MFVKTNTTGFADALTCEAEGLESLREVLVQVGVEHLRIPQVAEVDQYKLVMTQIVSVAPDERGQALLGEGLARLHQQEREHYGWGRDNYIGLSPQPNGLTESWGQFFVDYRLRYQVSRIADPVIRERFQRVVDQSSAALTRWLDSHCKHPSLLHGDLWRGNVLFDHDGPWLIDPAVYQGDREADIAMTEMFGGFGAAFYRAYDSVYPRSEVYTTKREIYNLYHYLNHYNLFGGGYLGGCERGMAVVVGFKS